MFSYAMDQQQPCTWSSSMQEGVKKGLPSHAPTMDSEQEHHIGGMLWDAAVPVAPC